MSTEEVAQSFDTPSVHVPYSSPSNLRVIQLLLGHTELKGIVRYLGIEVDDALEISEQTEVVSVSAIHRFVIRSVANRPRCGHCRFARIAAKAVVKLSMA